jgi:branched-chain amino acid aminotransferase
LTDVTRTWTFIDGKFLREEDAKVSVYDHGFLYGDGIFDDMIALKSKVFRLDDHIERLYASAHAIGMRIPYSKEEMRSSVLDTVARNNMPEAYIRIIVSRGQGYPLLDPRISSKRTVVIMTYTREVPPSVASTYKSRETGLRTIIVSTRKTPSASLDPRVKSLNYLNNVLARMEAINAGADDAILLDSNNCVAEAPGANICVVRNKTVYSPEAISRLDGITLEIVLGLAAQKGYRTRMTNMTPYDLYTANEIFLTSTTPGIAPVAEVDGRKIGEVQPGPITKELQKALRDLMVSECS